MKVERCRSCPAQIVWLKTKLGRSMPVNAESISGALCISGSGKHDFTPDMEYDSTGATVNCETCAVDRAEWRATPMYNREAGHVSHFATCPAAKKWKGKKRG